MEHNNRYHNTNNNTTFLNRTYIYYPTSFISQLTPDFILFPAFFNAHSEILLTEQLKNINQQIVAAYII